MLNQKNKEQALPLQQNKIKTHIHKTYTSISTNIHLALRYSMLLTSCFIVVFIIARTTGLYKFTGFRFINYLLFYPIGFLAVQKAYNINNHYLEYFNGLLIGFMTVIMGQFWYAILFYIYLSFDHSFLQYLSALMPQPFYFPKLSIFVVLLIEGLGAATILSLTLMQYFKWTSGRWAFNK